MPQSQDRLHDALGALNRARLVPIVTTGPAPISLEDLVIEARLRMRERAFVEEERSQVRARAATAPRDSAGFVAWFEELRGERARPKATHFFPGSPSTPATRKCAGSCARKSRARPASTTSWPSRKCACRSWPKLELARNYWDEMGRGDGRGMHGPMLDKLAQDLDVRSVDAPVVWETVALGNLMVALAANREYTYQSLGALGVIELTAPSRAELVNRGLVRLGVQGAARRYYALHATLDKQHAAAWIREVLIPLVDENPETAPAMAEGALMRLEAGARCFARYRESLWGRDAMRSMQ